MTLAPGTRIGSFEITAKLGEGGMGEVYRARDSGLGRDVAIKILPPSFAADLDRLARFEREARALAALNHPNIAHIYEMTSEASSRALVMELVEGQDLSALIAAGPIPLSDALPIARQIADALEFAHEHGIVHRDLKPANVKVRSDGMVKVLDFGLAKALSPMSDDASRQAELANSPTLTARATQLGMILGTAAYMAPEQARGKAVDRRADIWAFGVVLYEMLSGRRAFEGEDVSTTMAAVLMKEPDWGGLPATTPRALQQLIRRCIERDPKQRLRDIGEARIILNDPAALQGLPAPIAVTPAPAATRPKSRTMTMIAAAALALAAGVAGGIAWQRSRIDPPAEWTASRLGGPAVAFWPETSPDGQFIAFQTLVDGNSQAAVMKAGTANWKVITSDRTRGLINSMAWSPDGSRIFFDRVQDVAVGIYSVEPLGGPERPILPNAGAPLALADGGLLFLRPNNERILQVHRYFPNKGEQGIEALPFISDSLGFMLGRQIDAGRVAIFGRPIADRTAPDDLYVVTLATGESRKIGVKTGAAIDNFNNSLAIDPTDHSILVVSHEGNTAQVIRIAPDHPADRQTVLTFVSEVYLSNARAGELILSLHDRPQSVLRYGPAGGAVSSVVEGLTYSGPPLGLPDGRVLITSTVGAATRVMVLAPGLDPIEFAQTDQRTSWPMTTVGPDRVALTFGPDGAEIGIVSIATGAIVKRLSAPGHRLSLGASPNGKTLYVPIGGSIQALSVETGESRPIGKGDSLTVDPDTGDLIVKLDEADHFRLVRMNSDGGAVTPIELHGDRLRLIGEPLCAGMIRKGRMALPAGTVDSWNWLSATLMLSTGQFERVPMKENSDIHFTTWAPDGQILATGLGMNSALWKFTRR